MRKYKEEAETAIAEAAKANSEKLAEMRRKYQVALADLRAKNKEDIAALQVDSVTAKSKLELDAAAQITELQAEMSALETRFLREKNEAVLEAKRQAAEQVCHDAVWSREVGVLTSLFADGCSEAAASGRAFPDFVKGRQCCAANQAGAQHPGT